MECCAKKQYNYLPILLIIITGFIVYFNSFSNQFVWDDEFLIKKNFLIKGWGYAKNIFSTHLFYGCGQPGYFYRPIQSLTLLADYSIWHLNPFGYHLTNTLLHIFNAILVYFLTNKLFATNKIAIFAGLLFVVHPIYTEAVTYISGRADVLSTFFALISLFLLISFIKTRRWAIYFLSILGFILALLSKENMIIFPLIILLYLILFANSQKNRNIFIPITPFVLISCIYAALRLTILYPTANYITGTNLYFTQKLLLACKVFTKYLALYIAPLHLHMERNISIPKSIFEPSILLSIIIILSVIKSFKRLYRVNKGVTFCIFWFFIFFIPISNMFQLNARMADHWLYTPSIGLAVLVGVCFDKLSQRYSEKIILIFAIFVLGIYSIRTMAQNTYWKDEITIYKKTLYYNPDSHVAHYNLGTTYKEKNMLKEAQIELAKAIQLKLDYIEAYNNLGNVYLLQNYPDKAILCFKKAVSISPQIFEPYYNLGNAYYQKGDYEKTITNFQKALALEKNKPDIHYNLAMVYGKTNQTDKAIKELEATLKLNPKDSQAMEFLKELRK